MTTIGLARSDASRTQSLILVTEPSFHCRYAPKGGDDADHAHAATRRCARQVVAFLVICAGRSNRTGHSRRPSGKVVETRAFTWIRRAHVDRHDARGTVQGDHRLLHVNIEDGQNRLGADIGGLCMRRPSIGPRHALSKQLRPYSISDKSFTTRAGERSLSMWLFIQQGLYFFSAHMNFAFRWFRWV